MDFKKFKKAKEIEGKIQVLLSEKNNIISKQKRIFQKEIGYGERETANKELFNRTYEKIIAEIEKEFAAEINKLEKEFEKI